MILNKRQSHQGKLESTNTVFMSKQEQFLTPLEDILCITDGRPLYPANSRRPKARGKIVTQPVPSFSFTPWFMCSFIHSFNKQCLEPPLCARHCSFTLGPKRRKHSCWPLWRVTVAGWPCITAAPCGRGCNGSAQLCKVLCDHRGKGDFVRWLGGEKHYL